MLRIIKNQNISQTRWKTLAFTVINYIRDLIAQKLDDNGIHFFYVRKFCRRPASEVSVFEKSTGEEDHWCPAPHLKSVPPHFTFAPLVVAYIQYSILKMCPHPAAKSWRRAWSKVAARLRLDMRCWCISEECQYSISAIVMAAAMTDFLLKCNIGHWQVY